MSREREQQTLFRYNFTTTKNMTTGRRYKQDDGSKYIRYFDRFSRSSVCVCVWKFLGKFWLITWTGPFITKFNQLSWKKKRQNIRFPKKNLIALNIHFYRIITIIQKFPEEFGRRSHREIDLHTHNLSRCLTDIM